jgi:hypothetical protein
MYKRFITNGNVPIVIKSITYYDRISNEMSKLTVGKFGQQQPYSKFVYAQQYITLMPSNNTGANYYNIYNLEFAPIIIDYYYYDGMNWQEDTESIGDNTDSWYVNYTDNIGNIYHQHKFEYPLILLPYFKEYSISKYAIDKYALDKMGMDAIPYMPGMSKKSLDQMGMDAIPYMPGGTGKKSLNQMGMSEMPVMFRSLNQMGMSEMPVMFRAISQKMLERYGISKKRNKKSEWIPGNISGSFSDV